MLVLDDLVVLVEDIGLCSVEALLVPCEDHKRLLVLTLHKISADESALDDVVVLDCQGHDADRVHVVDPDVAVLDRAVLQERRIVEPDISADGTGSAQALQLFAVHNVEAVGVEDLLHAVELALRLACVDLDDLAEVCVVCAASLREVELLEFHFLAV